MGNVMKISSPLPNSLSTYYPVMDIVALFVLGKDIPLNCVFKHIFLSIVLFNLTITFSFPLVCLNLIVIYTI